MSAPTIKEDWESALRASKAAITDQAIQTARAVYVVPCDDGGIQIELHAGGCDFELEIEPDGRVSGIIFQAVKCPS